MVKRIFLIDDDERLLKSLARLLRVSGFEVEPFSGPEAFLERLPAAEAGCVVTDLRMPGLSGMELLERLKERALGWPVIFLTGQGEIRDSVAALKRGAVNFLTKPVERATLLAALEEAFAALESAGREKEEAAELRKRYESLTPRERQVYGKIARGLLNKQAADDLKIALKTIKVHRARVMEKMQAGSVAELVRMYDRVAE